MGKKVVLITGGSGDIGQEITKELVKDNFQVIANFNKSEEKAKEMQKKLKEKKYDIDIYKADVTNRLDIQELVNYTIDKYGKIDVLINNAGIDQIKMFQDITDKDWNNMINTNLYSVFCVTQETIKNMIKNRSGCIINISSIWGRTGASCECHYAASKAGIDAITKSLAKELGPCNIRVNSIAPGIIDTKMNNELNEEDKNKIKQQIPLERIGLPKDISRCVKWLIGDEYVTGQIIDVNGGWYI